MKWDTMPYQPAENQNALKSSLPISNSQMHPEICDIKYDKYLKEMSAYGDT